MGAEQRHPWGSVLARLQEGPRGWVGKTPPQTQASLPLGLSHPRGMGETPFSQRLLPRPGRGLTRALEGDNLTRSTAVPAKQRQRQQAAGQGPSPGPTPPGAWRRGRCWGQQTGPLCGRGCPLPAPTQAFRPLRVAGLLGSKQAPPGHSGRRCGQSPELQTDP